MATRPTRADSTVRNRAALLVAARRVFLERGFHGATLESIALEAGFSKGVVYSQFDSKGDLFLALLDERRVERGAENARRIRPGTGGAGLLEMMNFWAAQQEDDLAWTLLVMEFRIHAARDAVLSARYSALHEQTLDGVVELLESLYRERPKPPVTMRTLASFMLALGSGFALERTSNPGFAIFEEASELLGVLLDPGTNRARSAPAGSGAKRRTG